MALPVSAKHRQELPPAGGFPAVRYKKFLPQRGPASIYIILGAVGVTVGGIWYAMKDNLEREYVQQF